MKLSNYYLEILKEVVKKRKESPFTLVFLAKSLEKSSATLSNFETGKLIDYDLLENYANIFDKKLILITEIRYLHD